MKKQFLQATLFAALVLQSGCITPKAITNNFVYGEYESLRNLHISIMPFMAEELSDEEIEDVTQKIVFNLSNFANIKQIVLPVVNEEKLFGGENLQPWEKINYFKNNRIINKLISEELKNKWESNWDNYLNKKEVNKDVLNELGNILDVNTVLQFAVTEIIKIKPVHRQVIAETTVKIRYALFSLNGSVLLEGKSIAKDTNAWSGQLTPQITDVVAEAINDILENFHFNKNL